MRRSSCLPASRPGQSIPTLSSLRRRLLAGFSALIPFALFTAEGPCPAFKGATTVNTRGPAWLDILNSPQAAFIFLRRWVLRIVAEQTRSSQYSLFLPFSAKTMTSHTKLVIGKDVGVNSPWWRILKLPCCPFLCC